MDKVLALLKMLGFELTADQTKQIEEVIEKEFVAADAADAQKTKLESQLDGLKNQLAEHDKDLEKLKSDTSSADLKKQLDELNAKYDADTKALTEKLTAQEADFAAEKLFGGYSFASERVKQSVLAEFKSKGFKYENGVFVGGKEYLEGLKKTEPDAFAKEAPGLFMGSTQSSVPTEENNLKAQIFSGFGLKND